ncbi:uncharacterized protein LOC143260939 [Megalopta genalis]|uniref:uncharacterized protein LOC143260939 n=1 Tax=Megalopta genalis TaxID=115081 RepID=UPI003FD11081
MQESMNRSVRKSPGMGGKTKKQGKTKLQVRKERTVTMEKLQGEEKKRHDMEKFVKFEKGKTTESVKGRKIAECSKMEQKAEEVVMTNEEREESKVEREKNTILIAMF